jgi:hypothetical protein
VPPVPDLAASLTWDHVLAWRLRRQHLDRRAPAADALDVASRLCGLHAQVMSSAELTLWARVEGLDPDWVRRALWEERSLVKTWAMRGTLHLIPAVGYREWQAALGTYDHYLKPAWSRAFGVSPPELERLVAAIGEVLHDRCLTREELSGAVAAATGSADLAAHLRESWGSLLKPAAFQGQLCFAPSDGQKVRFTHPDTWIGDGTPPDPEEGVRAITRRYLGAYGPAVREDYGRWWGVSAARAGRRIAALGDAAVEVDVEGTRAWMLAAHVQEAAAAEPPRSVRLLPGFDQYVVSAPRIAIGPLLSDEMRPRVYRPQGWISPVLLVDGRIQGVWRHERKGRRLLVSVEPFKRLTKRVRSGAEREAEALAAFLGGELELSL